MWRRCHLRKGLRQRRRTAPSAIRDLARDGGGAQMVSHMEMVTPFGAHLVAMGTPADG